MSWVYDLALWALQPAAALDKHYTSAVGLIGFVGTKSFLKGFVQNRRFARVLLTSDDQGRSATHVWEHYKKMSLKSKGHFIVFCGAEGKSNAYLLP